MHGKGKLIQADGLTIYEGGLVPEGTDSSTEWAGILTKIRSMKVRSKVSGRRMNSKI